MFVHRSQISLRELVLFGDIAVRLQASEIFKSHPVAKACDENLHVPSDGSLAWPAVVDSRQLSCADPRYVGMQSLGGNSAIEPREQVYGMLWGGPPSIELDSTAMDSSGRLGKSQFRLSY